jgi:glycosyltransferase involved in cell wall biosynthesis
LKIAVNTRFLLKNNREGMGRYVEETFRRIVVAHPEHEFIFFFDRPYDEAFIFSNNITPVVLSPPARHPILFVIWYEWAIVRALKKYKADVFISPDNFCSIRTKVPTLLVIHDLAFCHFPAQVGKVVRWYYQYFTPKFVQKAARIACVSEYTKSDIVKFYGANPNKIDVCYSGVRDIFKPLSGSEKTIIRAKYADEKNYFYYIGAVHPRKNVHRLIMAFDAFKEATGSDFKFLIAGRFAWQVGEVKSAYDSAKHKADIAFLGFVSDEDSPKLMASSHAVLFASQFEGFGIPIVEAFNCELPVVTSNVSSMPEIAGDAGILVNPNSVEEITKAMIDLIENQDLYQKMVEKAKGRKSKFTWDFTAEVIWEGVEKITKSVVPT